MLLKVISNSEEIMIFQVDAGGKGIGEEDYFELCDDNRDREDYDISLVETPLYIRSRLGLEAERTLT